ncbi:MAG: glycosyltransferase [Firmicutes bacterium]|nr:glycosyltransferase [Bacillota bacterium]
MLEKRVLLSAMSLDLGGAETHVITLARELAKRGYHVTVVSQGGRLAAGLEPFGIPHYYARLHSRSPFALLGAIHTISDIIQRERPAILHAHARIPAWVCRMASRRRHLPLVTTYHGVYAAGFPWNLVTEPGDLTVAVSEDVAEHFVRHFGFDRRRVRVILNGIDTARFTPETSVEHMRSRYGVTGSPRIVHASRLSDEFAETALSLIPAIAMLREHYPRIQAVIVGDGDRLDEVRRRAVEVNEAAAAGSGRATGPDGGDTPKPVIVTGGQEEMSPMYALADIVLGVARVALEAMSCGKPVILAGEGGFRGLLDENMMDEAMARNFTARGSGRRVSPVEVVSELRRALVDPGSLGRLGSLGRDIVLRHYSIEKMVDGIEAVYTEALEGLGRDVH